MAITSNSAADGHSASPKAVAGTVIITTIAIAGTLALAALIVPGWLTPPDVTPVLVVHPALEALDLEATAGQRYTMTRPVPIGPAIALPAREITSETPPVQTPNGWPLANCGSSECDPNLRDEDSEDRRAMEQAAKDDDDRAVSLPEVGPASDVVFVGNNGTSGGSAAPSAH